MSAEDNKNIMRRTFEEIFNQGNLALADIWVAATFVNHAAPAAMLSGPESLKEHVVLLRTSFPNLHFTIEDLIADDERAAARITFRGTQRGVFRGFPPTDTSFVQSQMHMVRFVKGKIVDHWAVRDDLSLIAQQARANRTISKVSAQPHRRVPFSRVAALTPFINLLIIVKPLTAFFAILS